MTYRMKMATVILTAVAAIGVGVTVAVSANSAPTSPGTAVSALGAPAGDDTIQVAFTPAPADKLAATTQVTSKTICAADKNLDCHTTPDSVQLVTMSDGSQRSGAAFKDRLVYLLNWTSQECVIGGAPGSAPEPDWMHTGCTRAEVADASSGKYVEGFVIATDPAKR